MILAAAVASVVLVLVAAKAHGRQIRLEREAQGHMHVDFRRENPPFVEALWRRDRRLFWGLFGVLSTLALVGAVTAREWLLVPFLVAWAFASSFVVAGLASWIRFARQDGGTPEWRKSATAGSIRWWLTVLAAKLAVAAAWLWPALSALLDNGGVA